MENKIFDNVHIPNFISWCVYEKKIEIRKPTNGKKYFSPTFLYRERPKVVEANDS